MKLNDSKTAIENRDNNVYVHSVPLNVTLSDRSDLQITKVQHPRTVNSGKVLQFTYTVKNTGQVSTQVLWTDLFYIGTDSAYLANTAYPDPDSMLLSTTANPPVALNANEGYEVTTNLRLPLNLSGRVYIKGITDFHDKLTEENEGLDNGRVSSRINVKQSPIANLVVSDISFQPSYFSGKMARYSYEVMNTGNAKTLQDYWSNQLLLLKASGGIERRITDNHSKELLPGDKLTVQDSFYMPYCTSGTFKVRLNLDYKDKVIELNNQDNSQTTNNINLILSPRPDLMVDEVKVLTNTPTTGEVVEVAYKILNDGNTDFKPFSPVYNYAYLSANQTFEVKQDRFFGMDPFSKVIPSKQSRWDTLRYNLPEDVPGDHYFLFYADYTDKLCEFPYEDNNVNTTAQPVTVKLAPPSDLQSKDLVFDPANGLNTSQSFTASAIISNEGVGPTSAFKWLDQWYLISGDDQDTMVLNSRLQQQGLIAKENYQLQELLRIPAKAEEKQHYLAVATDVKDKVYEHQAEDNNYLNSQKFQVTRDPNAVSDLAVGNFQVTSSINAGQSIDIDLTVENQTEKQTWTSTWFNRIYLLDADKTVVKFQKHFNFGKIAGKATKQESLKFSLPNGKAGDYYLKVELDTADKILEYNETNNTKTIPININLPDWADLEPTSISGLPQVRGGQDLNINFRVANNGKATTKVDEWRDRVFISKDEILDDNDQRLTTVVRSNWLNANDGYTVNKDVRIPKTLFGFYYLIIKTDAGDEEYEHTDENNNRLVSSNQVQVIRPKPADLEVTNMNVQYKNGASVKAFITIQNNGPNAIEGKWTDALYFSDDREWSAGDYRMGADYPHAFKKLPAGAKDSFYLSGSFPIAVPGYYHVILRLDQFNRIPETNEFNNYYTYSDSFYYDPVQELKVDSLYTGYFIRRYLANNIFNSKFNTLDYYKMNIGRDTGIYLQLDLQDEDAVSELFTKSDGIPSPGDYEYKYNNAFAADQQIAIPSDNAIHTDYILAQSRLFPRFYDSIPYTLLAESKEFSVTNIYPEEGGNNGMVIVDVNGFDFKDSLNFYLLSQNQQDTITGFYQYVLSTTKARIHFDLRDHPAGQYDLVGEKPLLGAKTVFDQQFQVSSEGTHEMETNVTTPARQLVGRKVVTKVNFSNQGNINAYDYYLNVVFYRDDFRTEGLDVKYIGNANSAKFKDSENPNPIGRSNFLDTLGMSVYSLYYPIVPAHGYGDLSFEISSAIEGDVKILAYWGYFPRTDYAFTGRWEDLTDSRYFHMMDSAISYKIGQEGRNKMTNCDEDFNIENMEKEVAEEVLEHAQDISGFDPFGLAADKAFKTGTGFAMKKTFSNDGAEVATEIVVKGKTQMEDAKGTYDMIKGDDPRFKEHIDFLGECINNDPDLKKRIVNKCNYEVEIPDPSLGRDDDGKVRTTTVIRNNCDDPPPSDSDPGPGTKFLNSLDPNEIVGPAGVGDLKLVQPGDDMQYEIRFENKATASAPAQQVVIQNPLEADFKLKEFQLDKLAFGDTVFQLPAKASYQKDLKLGQAYSNYWLRVTAGVDPIKREAFWVLTTIDPQTGAQPLDPDAGFLPPNDSTGIGEGFVTYSIKTEVTVASGDSINNEAAIIFDDNKPLNTNTWTNMVVSDDLASEVGEISQFVDSASVRVNWENFSPKPYGPDLAGYTIYVSDNDVNYEKWLTNTENESAIFTGEKGKTYYFFSLAHGTDGSMELAPADYDAKVLMINKGTGLNEADKEVLSQEAKSTLRVFPNPSRGNLNLAYRTVEAGEVQLQVTDLNGSVVHQRAFGELQAGWHSSQLTIGQTLDAGVYLIQLRLPDQVLVRKWIKAW